ncbi:homocysteine biosynthesis protein [Methanococcoides seepicolus]|uniref:Homocysteine biosynthesis protein n=1 Tax=Methanococcoides seepicolus TaxID=2828780 RepID=A0A9E5DB67_9EURY|nr:homocysteine biosynthesis protein [Methanococcoides seepicolus]MCM1986592.1 homocysteine biosynthesis protein [Methanococcoides seepicolus]
MVKKTIHEINGRIRDGSVNVVTAEEMVDIVGELGAEGAAKEVDVVTTGTFGAMCSSGVWLNFGHSEPPIRINKLWLNDVEAYSGVAAVDAYIGATQASRSKGLEYGGAHVIEDLIRGRSIDVHGTSSGTDCYPRKVIDTTINIYDLNQAIMLNPRNAYQKYNAATNSTNHTLNTYMGTLLPNHGNVTYSGAGVLSPMHNDPNYETIGTGTRIFLGGAQGYIVGEGTQHSPAAGFGTLMLKGDLKEMSSEYIRAASFEGYGTSLYVGMGIPIPVLNEDIAKATAVTDDDIVTNLLDYGIPSSKRPAIRSVTYGELRSGSIDINGKEVTTSSLSSFKKSRQIANELKDWIKGGEFFVSMPVERLPRVTACNSMKLSSVNPLVGDIMTSDVSIIRAEASFNDAAKTIMDRQFSHLPVVDKDNSLVGIVTAWDISKAVAKAEYDLVKDIMTKDVVTTSPDEAIDIAAFKLDSNSVSALPVIDAKKQVVGIITSDDISKLLARRQ